MLDSMDERLRDNGGVDTSTWICVGLQTWPPAASAAILWQRHPPNSFDPLLTLV